MIAEAMVLTPQGRIEHVLHLVDDGATTWITTDPGHAAPLSSFLESMRFMLRVEVADRSADLRVVGEPHSAPGLPGEPPVWVDPWPGPVGATAVRTADDLEVHPGEGWAWREVVLPAASPNILTGMRISLAISLILAILAEMIVSNDGLGYFTLLAERTFKVPDMYAGIFTLALFGYVLNRLFLLAESRLIRWHQESSGRR